MIVSELKPVTPVLLVMISVSRMLAKKIAGESQILVKMTPPPSVITHMRLLTKRKCPLRSRTSTAVKPASCLETEPTVMIQQRFSNVLSVGGIRVRIKTMPVSAARMTVVGTNLASLQLTSSRTILMKVFELLQAPRLHQCSVTQVPMVIPPASPLTGSLTVLPVKLFELLQTLSLYRCPVTQITMMTPAVSALTVLRYEVTHGAKATFLRTLCHHVVPFCY